MKAILAVSNVRCSRHTTALTELSHSYHLLDESRLDEHYLDETRAERIRFGRKVTWTKSPWTKRDLDELAWATVHWATRPWAKVIWAKNDWTNSLGRTRLDEPLLDELVAHRWNGIMRDSHSHHPGSIPGMRNASSANPNSVMPPSSSNHELNRIARVCPLCKTGTRTSKHSHDG